MVILLVYVVYTAQNDTQEPERIITNDVILKEIESLGKMELVKYNFKEITELIDISETYFNLFKLGPDQKIALISEGQAVGCIDLAGLQSDDITQEGDTIYIRLPRPEICYYKLDLNKTRIYSLQTNPFENDSEFIEQAYKQAEKEIKQAAIRSGILRQTRNNADLILKPMLETITKKVVIIQHSMDTPLPTPSFK